MDKTQAPGGDAWSTQEIGVDGMTCDHCAQRVEKALRAVAGVKDVRVDRAGARAVVTFDGAATAPGALRDAVRKSGYRPC